MSSVSAPVPANIHGPVKDTFVLWRTVAYKTGADHEWEQIASMTQRLSISLFPETIVDSQGGCYCLTKGKSHWGQ